MTVRVIQCERAAGVADHVAEQVIAAVSAKPDLLLGLPTGGTSLQIYRRLVTAFRVGRISFRDVTTVNVDEYVGLAADHPRSYARYMHAHLFRHVDADPRHTHIPNGAALDPAAEAKRYERLITALGGIDLLVLGLGVNGHIAFNEPGSACASRTRVVELAPATLRANRRFFARGEKQPTTAITIGIGTILAARRIIVAATGRAKGKAVAAMLSDMPIEHCPAAALASHPSVCLVVDRAAAALPSL